MKKKTSMILLKTCTSTNLYNFHFFFFGDWLGL